MSRSPAQLWWRHMRWPLLAFAVASLFIWQFDLDLWVARELFFSPASAHWLGAGAWWANDLIHHGGAWLVRLLGAAALCLWGISCFNRGWAGWRRPAGYLALSMALTVGVVGALKALTNIDCPWDLIPFGGHFPYEHLFDDRPDYLPHARCFPAAHASSGYALMALYFVALERSQRMARMGLRIGIITGLVFGIAQQARGAHFLSHDVSSAAIAWVIASGLYAGAFRAQLWDMRHWPSMVLPVQSSAP